MSILVYTSSSDGKFNKSAFEVVSYGKKISDELGTDLVALSINATDVGELETYGAETIVTVESEKLTAFNAKAYASVICQIAELKQATTVIIDSSINGLYLAPLVSVALDAGYVSNVVAAPSSISPFIVKRKAFSNKGFNNTLISTENKVIGLAKNAFGVHKNIVSASIENAEVSLIDSDFTVTLINTDKASGKVTIADADIVVSGGRGLKGPENWGIVEELAAVLGAATACSKPVSDLGWRPHGEHVGQTGKPVATNLYFAIGISGAIQHLAGINASKVKVVINSDPEAPFFKAADYGIIGDAFNVVPQLINKLKEFKLKNS